jgi:hypothetical protein
MYWNTLSDYRSILCNEGRIRDTIKSYCSMIISKYSLYVWNSFVGNIDGNNIEVRNVIDMSRNLVQSLSYFWYIGKHSRFRKLNSFYLHLINLLIYKFKCNFRLQCPSISLQSWMLLRTHCTLHHSTLPHILYIYFCMTVIFTRKSLEFLSRIHNVFVEHNMQA